MAPVFPDITDDTTAVPAPYPFANVNADIGNVSPTVIVPVVMTPVVNTAVVVDVPVNETIPDSAAVAMDAI